MPKLSWLLIGLALALAAGGAIYYFSTEPPVSESAHGGQANSDRARVKALGRLEPEGGVIAVGAVAGDRLERLVVHEGQQVKAGDELALLASYPMRLKEKELAEAQLKEARDRGAADLAYGAALVAEAEAAIAQLDLAQLDIDALRAKSDLLELNFQVATKDLERLQAVGKPVVSPQELEHQTLLVAQSKAELNSAKAQLKKLEATRTANRREAQAKLATAKASQRRLQAAAQLDSLEENVAAAGQRLEASIVRAPRDGRVLKIIARPGEALGAMPVLKLGDTRQMFAVAEVYETDVGHVRPGQLATVSSDALTAPLTGRVESIGSTVAKNDVMSVDPTASTDARVVEALIRLDDAERASRLINLQVDVEIDTAAAEGGLK
jgi:HlyD family secretion protein